MKRSTAIGVVLVLVPLTMNVAPVASRASAGGGQSMQEAKGNVDVQMTPEPASVDGVGRYSISKTFRGDIEGTSAGEMLAVRTRTAGSAGYVLIEHVTGKVKGRSGSFMIQHFGLMNRDKPELRAEIIPDSGDGDLVGIAGTMTINAADNHSYALTYSLPAS